VSLDDIANNGIDRNAARNLFLKYELFAAIKKLGLDKDEPQAEVSAEDGKKCEECADISELSGDEIAVSLTDDKIVFSDGERICRMEIGNVAEDILHTHKIIACDCKSIYKALEKYGISWRECYFDVMLAAYVDDSNQGSYMADRLAAAHLGETVDADIPEAYYIARMWRMLEQRLSESGQLDLLYDVEIPLAAVLCDMEIEGCAVDSEGIASYGVVLDETISAL
jgi:DNA polymerase I-like protein with 3'-5' exonuclease and polymerase domains